MKGGLLVRIAITTEGRNISQEIGKTIKFMIVEVVKGKVKGKFLIDVSACGGQDAVTYILKNEAVEVLLCGKITEQLKMDLKKHHIEVVADLKGNTNIVLKDYIRGYIKKS